MTIQDELSKLSARLPELEWQLNKIGARFPAHRIPKNMFKRNLGDSINYVEEIKNDINRLRHTLDERSAHFLADKINQKINTLVTLCIQCNKQTPTQESKRLTINKLTSRQNWLQEIEATIAKLSEQKNALLHLITNQSHAASEHQLNLQLELGQLEKQLTIAQETFSQLTS